MKNKKVWNIPIWIKLALPEDVKQEIALSELEYPNLTKEARQRHIKYKLAVLRHEVWDRYITKKPKTPHGLRPSKMLKSKGYRKNKNVISN